jgi:hypothetical protein
VLSRLRTSPSRRDSLLALGAVCLAVAFLLVTGSEALILRDIVRFQYPEPFRYNLGHWLRVFSGLVLSFAFGLAAWGLIGGTPLRSSRLGVAMVVAAISFLAGAAATILVNWEFVQYHYLHIIGTAALTDLFGRLAFTASATTAAIAFFRARRGGGGRRELDDGLELASSILSIALALSAATGALRAAYWGSSPLALIKPSDAFLAGYWISAAAFVILAVGAVITAQAFRGSTERDRRLTFAATVFAIGFLANAVGATLSQINNPNITPFGTAGWFTVAQAYVLVIAMVCAATGLQGSRERPA